VKPLWSYLHLIRLSGLSIAGDVAFVSRGAIGATFTCALTAARCALVCAADAVRVVRISALARLEPCSGSSSRGVDQAVKPSWGRAVSTYSFEFIASELNFAFAKQLSLHGNVQLTELSPLAFEIPLFSRSLQKQGYPGSRLKWSFGCCTSDFA
jgi:hypothetical protein